MPCHPDRPLRRHELMSRWRKQSDPGPRLRDGFPQPVRQPTGPPRQVTVRVMTGGVDHGGPVSVGEGRLQKTGMVQTAAGRRQQAAEGAGRQQADGQRVEDTCRHGWGGGGNWLDLVLVRRVGDIFVVTNLALSHSQHFSK